MKKNHSRRAKSAVSLRYDSLTSKAPKVTAKGKGQVAENIIALAHEHNIPVQQDPDLIEVLSQVDVDQEIPPAVYQVVAELLAFVYKMNNDYQSSD
jgi:flagellar biosynthesis protein